MRTGVRMLRFVIKTMGWTLVLVFNAWLALGYAKFFQAVVTRWPEIVYDWRKPSTADECNRIRQGMDLSQILDVINHKAEPLEQNLRGDRFTFWRKRHSCVAEFDPTTRRVVKAHLEESPIWNWYFQPEPW